MKSSSQIAVLMFSVSQLLTVSFVSGATFTVVNLPTDGMVYSPLDNSIYASVPDSSSINPDTLTQINPLTGALGAQLAVGFNPQNVVISTDGTMIYTAFGSGHGVQPVSIPSQSLGTPIIINGNPALSQLIAVPGQANAVLISAREFGNSSFTIINQNGAFLPNQVGNGPGVGGPDIVAIDHLNGSIAYGYDNSNTAYTNYSMAISSTGITGGTGPTLQGVLTGFNVSHIELLGNDLFDDRGEVFSLSPAIQVGAFLGGSDFVLDPGNNELFSITTSGSTQTIHAYSLKTFHQIGTDTITGISGNTSNLVRFGIDGLAFDTSNNQVVLVHSASVPEPSGLALSVIGFLLIANFAAAYRNPRRAANSQPAQS